MARVINLKGRKLKQLEEGEVYIGRQWNLGGWHLPKSKWFNPFKITPETPRQQALEEYRRYLLGRPDLMADLHELRGKTLCCWCSPEKCHGEILVELLEQLE